MTTAGEALMGTGTVPGAPTTGKVSVHSLTGADLQIKNDAGAVLRVVTESFTPGLNLGAASGALSGQMYTDSASAVATDTALRINNSAMTDGQEVLLELGKAYGSNTSFVVSYVHNGSTPASRYLYIGAYELGATPTLKIDATGGMYVAGNLNLGGVLYSYSAADGSPFTKERITVYKDPSNWGYLAYGADASLRIVHAKTGAGGPLLFGSTSAFDNTGTFTKTMGLDTAGNLTVVGGFGCNTKATQAAYASGGDITPGAGSFGASSAANFAAMVTLVKKIRTALVNNGIMS